MKNLFLVTGGTGFLGFQIIQMLTEQQEKVRTLVLPDDPDAQRLPNSVEVVCGNIVTKQGFDDFFAPLEGYDQVMLHCAAIVTLDENPSQSLYDVNVNGSINIIDAQTADKVPCRPKVGGGFYLSWESWRSGWKSSGK